MESSYALEGCWAHVGHHHYFVGRDAVFALHGGGAVFFVVEQQLSPPTEGPAPGGGEVRTPVPVEVSVDGRAWTRVADGPYRLVYAETSAEALIRQEVAVNFTAPDVPFRYLRVRQPLSSAEGLSGYVDASRFELDVTVVARVPPASLAPGERGLSCERDILEDVFPSHPCWFGGLNRWDAPSFFHTYPLGGLARLDRVSGVATLAYFRPDDRSQLPPEKLGGHLLVEASEDGSRWTTIANVSVAYGTAQPFATDDLGGLPAAFVRLASDRHPRWGTEPPLKRPEAYLLESSLALGGLLPAGEGR